MLAHVGHIVVVDDDPSLRQLVIGYLEITISRPSRLQTEQNSFVISPGPSPA